MKKIIAFILLVATVLPFYSIFAPSNSPFVADLCAQQVGQERGNSCIPNYGDCSTLAPAGTYSNFLEDFGNGDITWGGGKGSVGDFRRVYNKEYGDNANLNCYVKNSIKYIVSVPFSPAEDYNDELERIAISEVWSDWVPRGCNPGTVPSASTNYGIVGCCPTGYKLVTTRQQTMAANSTLEGAACCLMGGATSPDYFERNSTTDYEKCRDNAGNSVWTVPTSGGKPTVIITNAAINTFALGDSTGVFSPVSRVGSEYRCPDNSQCALTDNSTLSVVDPERYKTVSGLTCDSCFTTGDTIGTSTAATGATDNPGTPVDESVGFVRYCAGAGGAIRDETLIGTPDITKGYLLEDETNQALYKECFDTGGIYTAIGCVDPTPTGIITGLIRIALGVMGGVALLQMVYVGILYQQGNTEKIKGARTQLIATLTGVAVLVFSVLILRIIGVNILDILSVGSV